MAKQRLVFCVWLIMQFHLTMAAPLASNLDGSVEFDGAESSLDPDTMLGPNIEDGLGPMDLQSRAKRKEQADQRLAMFLAFNGDGRNHFVHTQSCPKHNKRNKDSKRRNRPHHRKENDEESISRTIGELLMDALKSKGKCKRNKSLHKETIHNEETDNEIIGDDEKETKDNYPDEFGPEDDGDEDVLDETPEILDDEVDEDLPDDYSDNDKIPESGEINIHSSHTEKKPINKCTHQPKPTTCRPQETTTHRPQITTSSPPVTGSTTHGYHTTTQSPCTQPEHVIDGSMSNSHIQSLLKRLLGLHCSCKSTRRRHGPSKPIVVVENTHRAVRRTTPEFTTKAPLVATTEEIIPHVIKPRPSHKLRSPFQNSPNSIDRDHDHPKSISETNNVENTINMVVGKEVSKQRSHGRSRKPHRTSRPIAKTKPPKELHIILDQDHNEIGEEIEEETDNDQEELDEEDEDNYDGQESRHDLQYFRDHRGRNAKATEPKTSEPSRNWRARNRRHRGRSAARPSVSNDPKDSLQPENILDTNGIEQQRSQRGVERGTTSAVGQRRGSHDSGEVGDVTATDNSIYRASLPVGLKNDARTGQKLKTDLKEPPSEKLAINTADLLLKRFLSLYNQFKNEVGSNMIDNVKDD